MKAEVKATREHPLKFKRFRSLANKRRRQREQTLNTDDRLFKSQITEGSDCVPGVGCGKKTAFASNANTTENTFILLIHFNFGASATASNIQE